MRSKRPTFEEVAYDFTFRIVGVEVLQQEEKYAWCAFCGGRLRHPVLLERNDGKAFRVGKTCIGRAGLELTGSEKTVWKGSDQSQQSRSPRLNSQRMRRVKIILALMMFLRIEEVLCGRRAALWNENQRATEVAD